MNEDRRVQKTRQAIQNAFVELITEKNYPEITVKEIADRANVNRKTFYNHYADINALVAELETAIVRAFDEAMEGIDVQRALRDPEELCSRFLAIGYSCRELLSHLMNIRYDDRTVARIAQALKDSIRKSSGGEIRMDDQTFDILMEFAVAGMLQTYQTWFMGDRRQPVEEVTLLVSNLIVSGISGMRA
ncbi:MAG: TetR/AcrR family transcriptional regulator [Firmicutes bacterium]|nr:TetR/AcrR family transcriptional regulator [Bacillota bacterium]